MNIYIKYYKTKNKKIKEIIHFLKKNNNIKFYPVILTFFVVFKKLIEIQFDKY